MYRQEMLSILLRVAMPVLEAGSHDCLKETMYIEQQQDADRECCSVFEGVGRLICGIAPWLEVSVQDSQERQIQQTARSMARSLIAHQVDPQAADYAQFDTLIPEVPQLLVDMAFLAQGMLRAPHELIELLPDTTRAHLLKALLRSREILPYNCNWILFSSMVEALIYTLTGNYDPIRVSYGFRQFEQWYVGDGIYGDGPEFAMDYYNSYVIGPMLLDLIRIFPDIAGPALCRRILDRAMRYGIIQERMIAPDGTFIAVGRSICYRCGAFHHIAALAYQKQLPASLSEGQVRSALSAVIGKTLQDNAFRKDGFLTIGLYGSQPSLGEEYISTGSLYLCTAAFLVLGLPDTDSFWLTEEEDWTQKKIWKGIDLPRDHKLE